ncbi:MAG: glycosyltransferase [Ilumatobacter sp.]|nr:glycosyltransferase [Ilumatobacter sp.]
MVRFDRDGSWRRFGRVVVAGSPLTIFRTTAAAAPVLDAIEADRDVADSPLVERLVHAGAIHPRPGGADGTSDRRHGREAVTIVTPQLGGRATLDGRTTVDDGSHPPIEGASVRLERNCGPAAARNAGRLVVTTPLIAFVDADVELGGESGSWLDRLVLHFDDPRVGLVAPRVMGEPRSSLDLGTAPGRIRAGSRIGYVPGAAIVVRVEAFDDVGGFDEGLRYGEDVDFVWRLDQAGWRCRYEPASAVWHEPRSTWRGRLRQQVGYGTSAAPLALRHPSALTPVRSNGWTTAAWTAVLMRHPVVGLGVAIGSAGVLVPTMRDVPARAAFMLAMTGHLRAGQQYASAVRRVWWPIVAVAAIVSRRARVVLMGAIALDVASTPNDVAYGWGVWRGIVRHRTLRPIVPLLSAWPRRRS